MDLLELKNNDREQGIDPSSEGKKRSGSDPDSPPPPVNQEKVDPSEPSQIKDTEQSKLGYNGSIAGSPASSQACDIAKELMDKKGYSQSKAMSLGWDVVNGNKTLKDVM